MENELEIWRDVVGYEDSYQVSNLGNVKIINSFHKPKNGKIFNPFFTKGYARVALSKKGIKSAFTVHHLVSRAFLGECPPNHEVNHIDFNRANNCLSNLEYVTKKENLAHSAERRSEGVRQWHEKYNEIRPKGDNHWTHKNPELVRRGHQHKHTPEGEANKNSKLTKENVIEIKNLAHSNQSAAQIAKTFNVEKKAILRIWKGETWKSVS